MLLLRALILWSLISLHVVGGAAIFGRLFPRESRWFGFIVPGLALVLVLNFIEHIVALPTLLWLLPFTTLGSLWALLYPGWDRKGLLLPAVIFLASFAFTLGLRAIKPDIVGIKDGVVDLSLMSSFCMGEKVPPTLIWYPPLHLAQYYAFGHYAMSVVTRFLGLDVGTGFNLSSALFSSLECLLAAAVAWRISRQKLWITLLAPVLLECAATGATAYFWLTTKDFDPYHSLDILVGMDNPADHNPLWHWLHPALWYDRRELFPPGVWSWLGSFHSTSGGQFLVLFFTYALTEVLRRRSSNWPWLCLLTIPFFSVVTSTWAVLLEAPLLLGALYWVWRYKLAPESFRFVLLGFGLILALLAPTLLDFLTTTGVPGMDWTDPDARTEPVEFFVLWWPILLPWLALIFTWRKLPPVVKTVIVVLPFALLGMEFYTIAGRPDWTGKLWSYIFGVGWVTLIPTLCRRRGLLFRGLLGLLLASSLLSFIAWSQYTWRMHSADDSWHLEGTGTFRINPLRGNLLQALSQLKGQTVITGKSDDLYSQSPALVAFTGNRDYVTWSYFCDGVEGGNTYRQASRRQDEVNALYDGKCDNPLLFLRTHDIAALVIYPLDNVPRDVIAKLQKQLEPYYAYTDFSDDTATSGIFIFHPEMLNWPAAVLLPPSYAPAPASISAPGKN
ncbi:MAG: DUF2298 domain-containing protein [Methylacidiphilales bacterium]|nr:DUF2298 domain-containing protein [Candidatus Methylacidiphilales bacterium]